jgi:hypothetical protein
VSRTSTTNGDGRAATAVAKSGGASASNLATSSGYRPAARVTSGVPFARRRVDALSDAAAREVRDTPRMPAEEPAAPAPESAHRGGLTVREYEARVWDMARHQIHPTFLFVAAQVVAATRLLAHPAYSGDGAWIREAALFLAGFLGAWGCFYSTLLRVAGLRSVTVTVLVPLAVAVAAAAWFALPAPDVMGRGTLVAAELALVLPGVAGWALTMRRWRRARREAGLAAGGTTP